MARVGWECFRLNLMRIAIELARENHVYENIATKFFEHFLGIAAAMNNLGGKGIGLWDEEDEFYYDVLHTPGGRYLPLQVRSIVGLMPLLAVETIQWQLIDAMPGFKSRLEWYLAHRPDLASLVSRWQEPGMHETPASRPHPRPSHEMSASTHARSERISERLRHSFAEQVSPGSSLSF